MNYYKIKAATLERQIRIQQLQDDASKIDAAYQSLMVSEGLDALKVYRLNDADESVTEVTPEVPHGAE